MNSPHPKAARDLRARVVRFSRAGRAVALSAALAFTSFARAQPANAPHLAYAYPAGAARGTTVTLTLGGQYLADASTARFSGTGLTARLVGYERPLTQKEARDLREKLEQLRKQRESAPDTFPAESLRQGREILDTLARRNPRQPTPALAESVTLELTVAADAAPGTRELRLQTPAGLSNPLVFQIGSLPEVTPPAVTATSPGPRRPPQAATKRGPPLDVTLPALVNGQILPGEIDTVRFTARRGQQLTFAVSARTLVPYLADAVPGWFQAAIHLRDATGRELAFNDDFQFRPDPVIGCEIPADGTYELEIHDAIYRGREDFVYRVALGELPFVRSVFPLGATRGTTTTVALTGWNLPARELAVDARTQPAGTMLLSVQNAGRASNAVRFALGDLPETTESESAAPPLLAFPALVNGRIDTPDDRDVYRFTGRSGQTIVAEVFARRLDSPLDSHLELHAPDGRLLASNDDHEDRAEGLITHQADSRLTATLPADGSYTLALTDTQHRGGPEFGYRLVLRAPRPDFDLRVTPSAVNVPAGGSALITVFALRHDGFDGEIQLALAAPDSGFRLSGARIPSGVESVQLTLTAPPGAPVETLVPLELLGRATLARQSVTRRATAGDDTMQAFLYRHLVPANRWLAQVTPRTPPFRLTSAETVRLVPGRPATVRIAVAGRGPGIEQPTATLVNPPPGLAVTDCRARGRTLEVTLLLESLPPAAQRAGNLVLSFTGTRSLRQNPDAKPRPLGLAPAIPFEIVTSPTKGQRL